MRTHSSLCVAIADTLSVLVDFSEQGKEKLRSWRKRKEQRQPPYCSVVLLIIDMLDLTNLSFK